jgi:hypothetical protein
MTVAAAQVDNHGFRQARLAAISLTIGTGG